jgi:signal transduction histidine kinase
VRAKQTISRSRRSGSINPVSILLILMTGGFIVWTIWLFASPSFRKSREDNRLQVVERLDHVEKALQDLVVGGAVIPPEPPDEALRRWRVLFITYRRQIEQLDGREPAVQEIVDRLSRVYALMGQAEKLRQDILAGRYNADEQKIRELEFRRVLEAAAAEVRAASQKLRDAASRDGMNPLAFPLYPLAGSILSVFLLISHLRLLAQLECTREPIVEVQSVPVALRPPPAELFLPERNTYFQPNGMDPVRRLAGRTAHNFNNLLTSINGYSDLLLHSLDADDPNRSDIEEIKRAGDRAAFLAAQLLAFSGNQVAKPGSVNLSDLLSGMAGSIQPLAGARVHVAMDLAPELASVHVDQSQVEQVILSLVVNARDAMPAGGELTISTRAATQNQIGGAPRPCRAACVILSIRDTGVGMDQETRDQVFDPFFTTKEPGKGTGLGLSTAYGIIRQNGGNVRVRSELGKGSTFDVYFPAEGAAGSVPPVFQTRAAKSRFTLKSLRVESADPRG